MANIDQLLQRNKDFAASGAHEEASIIARTRSTSSRAWIPGPTPQPSSGSATVLPDTITVSGHVYDVTTGLVTTIIPAAPMHPRASRPTPQPAGAQSH